MIAFEVYVNNAKVCTAGLGELDGIVSSLLCSANKDGRPDEHKVFFLVSGLADKKSFMWVKYKLTVGDRVEVRIVDTEKVDPPKKIECKGGSCET
ncbi:MAG TPA: hypothetical protein VHZ30_03850 [Verrucomicrobiae bacterium]|jgi:hypothetical protein|nr:hypothetical protein [Verrucomicrobiae bacterium]